MLAHKRAKTVLTHLILLVIGCYSAPDADDAFEVLAKVKSGLAAKCPKSVRKHFPGGGTASSIYAAHVLLHQGHHDKASACAIDAIDASPRDGLPWTLLATALRANSTLPAGAWPPLFAEALRLDGPVSNPRFYEVLGPFSIGKGEVDGDPTEAPPLGGIARLHRGSRRRRFPSEFADGGYVHWRPLPSLGTGGASRPGRARTGIAPVRGAPVTGARSPATPA